jgi:hypothetical protein
MFSLLDEPAQVNDQTMAHVRDKFSGKIYYFRRGIVFIIFYTYNTATLCMCILQWFHLFLGI